MATFEELMNAARQADAAGETEDARRLLEMAVAVRGQNQTAPEQTWGEWLYGNLVGNPDDGITNTGEAIGSWLNRAGESMTLGLVGDEASAAITGMLPGRSYADELSRYRANERELGTVGQVTADLFGGGVGAALGGAALQGLRAGGVALPQASSLLGRMGYGAGLGAAGGLTHGFMEGEGGLGQRLDNAVPSAGWGLGIGFAAPAVVAGARSLGGTVRDMVTGGVDTVLGRASQGRANRALARTMERAGMDQNAVARALMEAADDQQDVFRVMDALGRPGQRRAAGIVRGGAEGADELASFLAQRQLDQTDRVGGFVEDALGFRGTPGAEVGAQVPSDVLSGSYRSAKQLEDALTGTRGAVADAQYAAARQGASAVNLNNTIESIDDILKKNPIIGNSALRQTEIGNRIEALRNSMVSPGGTEQLIDFDRVLNLKQDLGRQIETLKRAGPVPRELSTVYRELDRALEGASSGYRQANDTFRDFSRVVEALERGGQMARGGRAVDTTAELASMTPAQRAAAAIGYGDARLAGMEAVRGDTTNRMMPFNATKAQQEMALMAQDPALWERIRARENTMWQTQNRAMGGSMTADNLSDIADNGIGADVLRSAGEILTGNFRSAAGNAANAVSNVTSGLNAPTRELIARALMSGDANALSGAARAQWAMAQNQAMLERALAAAARGQYAAPDDVILEGR